MLKKKDKERRPDGVDGISSRALAHILSCSQGFPQNSRAAVEAGEGRGIKCGVLRPPATGGLKTKSGAKCVRLCLFSRLISSSLSSRACFTSPFLLTFCADALATMFSRVLIQQSYSWFVPARHKKKRCENNPNFFFTVTMRRGPTWRSCLRCPLRPWRITLRWPTGRKSISHLKTTHQTTTR